MTKKFSEVLIQSLTDFINGKNLFLFLILFLSVIFIGMLIFWNTQPDFQVLYSNLSQEDAAEISSKLKEKKIPFKFNQSGTTIMVPKEQVYEIRLNLANEGLPKGGGVGFEIFDRTNFGTTDFVQKLNYIRGLQGELSRTIKQIKEVEHARVHIAIPKDTLFVEEQKKPTASVFIRTRTGMALSSSQVEGIVHLISCAVEGLEPGNITVLDNTGKMLSKKQDQSSIGQLTSSQLEYQRNIEEGLKRKVQSMLEEVLGPNKAIARVTANIDFQQVDILEETYDPKPIPRSEQKTLEKSSSNNGSIEKGNTSYEGKASFSAGLISDRQSELRNYEVSKINKRIKNPIGVIKKISAAVIVDGTYAESIDSNGNRIRKYSPRSQEEMKGLENLVKKAIGYEEQRGDQVEIINMPFYSSNMEEDVKQIKDSFVNKYFPIVYKPAVSLILAILLILFIIRPILKNRSFSPKTEIMPIIQTSPQIITSEVSQETKQETLNLKEQTLRIIHEDPQKTIGILKKWLNEKE